MLRSFQYTEKSYLDNSMFSDLYREKEIAIARKFVSKYKTADNMGKKCPVCRSNTGQYFYTKWKVDYLRCTHCKSIFAVCEADIVRKYQLNSELLDLRSSENYQNQASQKRRGAWQDFIEWLEVRSYRFLRKNRMLNIVDVGNRFQGYSKLIQTSALCGRYDLRQSILGEDRCQISDGNADLVLYLDQLQKESFPDERLQEIRNYLKNDGIFVLSTRAGSGFDIITLKENNHKIYPYEHVFLPSVKGIVTLLEQNGFNVLEITTPGVMDVKYVVDCLDKMDEGEEFVRCLLTESSQGVLQEFQRFLQKSCLSSFVCVIAGKAS